MNDKIKFIYEAVGVVIASVIIISLIILLLKYTTNKPEGFCGSCGTCRGIGNLSYPNVPLLRQMYNSGELTEFSDRSGPRAWNNSNSNNNFQK
jgi:hypothetical protein